MRKIILCLLVFGMSVNTNLFADNMSIKASIEKYKKTIKDSKQLITRMERLTKERKIAIEKKDESKLTIVEMKSSMKVFKKMKEHAENDIREAEKKKAAAEALVKAK